jgi:prepilin-type N-terminal cleavage/methylation domain-containing protein
MRTSTAGFTLIEILVTLLLVSLTMTGVVTVAALHHKAYLQENVRVGIADNVRIGLDTLTDTLRNGLYGYGAPTIASRLTAANLANWITWVPGFTSNPLVTGTAPNNVVSVLTTSPQPVATLTARAAKGATTMTLSTVAGVNTGNESLLLIDGAENALVTAIAGATVTIDTNPVTAGNQGLSRSYPQNTPVYRVDVATFSLATTSGVSQLVRNDNQGAGAVPVVDDISGLQVTTVVAGTAYQITLSATSSALDPLTNTHLQANLTSNVVLAN